MRRALVLAVTAGLALLAVALRPGAEPDRPVATVGHAGAEPAPTTTATPPAPAPAPATTTTAPTPRAAATRSTTVVRTDAGGVTVVNEGSASASSGNNTVIGPPSAQGPSGPQSGVTVTEGPVTAVGNAADVRIRP